MTSKKLISPEFRVTVGDYVLQDGMYIECVSSKASRLDWCGIEFDTSLEGVIPLNPMMPSLVELGYDEDFDELINGYLCRGNGDSWKQLMIKDDLMKLENITVKATFLDCMPQDIILYILTLAGITSYELDSTQYPKKEKVALREMNGLQAIADVGAVWGISQPFYFKNKTFRWGTVEQQRDIYVLEEDETIMALEKSGAMWRAEVIAVPWIHHSQEIMVRHTEYSGMVEVEQTKIQSDSSGVQMYIWFKG